MMTFVRFSFLVFLMLMLASCKTIYFNPDFFVADHNSQAIISERGEVISASDPKFDEYACMHIEKVKELKRILMTAKNGKNRARVLKSYKGLMQRMSLNEEGKISSGKRQEDVFRFEQDLQSHGESFRDQ